MRWRNIGFLTVAILLFPVGTLATSCPSDGGTTTCCCCCVCKCDPCDESAAETPEEDDPATETPLDDFAAANMHFNELFPNPVGTDSANEFIELTNCGAEAVSLAGWEIRDDKGRVFTFAEATIAPGAKIALPYSETKIPLPNGGGHLTLHDSSGAERDAAVYGETAPEGAAYASFVGIWRWTTTPTPGAENVLTVEEEEAPASGPTMEDDATDETTDEPADISTPIAVLLSEVLPNPVGNDADGEWIELYNPSGVAADLSGWILDDGEGGSSQFVFAEGTSVPAGGYLVITRAESKLALNNDTDSVRLSDPDGTLADLAEYADAKEGEAFARGVDGWSWTTTPTPGAANAFPTVDVDVEGTDPTSADDEVEETAADEDVPETVPVEVAHDFPDGTEITVIGMVTVPPGVISQTVFGLQDIDTDFGMTVRLYGDGVPLLAKGDIITVTGTLMRKANGELRINSSAARVAVLGSDEIIEKTRSLAELDGGSAGMAVSVQGTVTDIGSGWFIITDDDASHEIKIELPDGATHDLKSGDQVTVQGVIRTESSTLALAVVGTEDIAVVVGPESTSKAGDPTATVENLTLGTEADGTHGLLPFLTIGAIGAGGVAYRGLRGRNGSANPKKRHG